MSFATAQFPGVSTTPVLIASGVGETRVRIQADGLIAIGPTNAVTDTTGFKVQNEAIDIRDGDEVWAVKAQGPAVNVNVLTLN